MKVLVITQKVNKNDPILGFFHDWLKKIAEKVDKLIVIALEVGEYNLPGNVKILSLGKERGYGKLRRVFRFFCFSFFLSPKYDGVFVHMNPEYVVLGGWFWKIMNKKIILWYTHKSVTLKLKIANLFVNKIFTASKESCRIESDKVEVAGHGINLDLFKSRVHYPADKNLRLLTIGRIAPSKDVETIILAVSRLVKEEKDVTLDIVGTPILKEDFYYFKSLEILVKKLDLEKRIKFLGAVLYENLPQIYKEHDIFIHTSKTGSIDKVVLESMACGLNVVTSGEAFGFLDDKYKFKGNDVDGLVYKINNLKNNNPSDLRKIVQDGHNLDNLVKKIIDFYKQP